MQNFLYAFKNIYSQFYLSFPKAWLSEVEGKTGGRGDRRHSSDINHLVTQGRERSFFFFVLYFFSSLRLFLLYCPKFHVMFFFFFPHLTTLAFNNIINLLNQNNFVFLQQLQVKYKISYFCSVLVCHASKNRGRNIENSWSYNLEV